MACIHYLRHHFDLTIYERNGYAGGHTNTVVVDEAGTPVPIDTGFMVFNEATYPHLCRFFRELGVTSKPTDMSFSVQHLGAGLEYAGSNLDTVFAQRRNLLNPRFLGMLRDILRFNKEAREIGENLPATLSLGEFVGQRGYGRAFADYYLIPMSAAIWSTPPHAMLDFPALTLLRFFRNHGLLGAKGRLSWRTVVNGSQQYRDKLLAPIRDRIRLHRGVARVARTGRGVVVEDTAGARATFDRVIIAAPAHRALGMLDQPTDDEQRLLSAFTYTRNPILLHTDPTPMPRARRTWSSWNYRYLPGADGSTGRSSTIYWMNQLQQVSKKQDYFVSVDDPGLVDPRKVLYETMYEHPVFSAEAIRAQRELPQLNFHGPVYFCGSYFRYGFHEDAFRAGLQVVARLLPDLAKRHEFLPLSVPGDAPPTQPAHS